MFPKDVVVDQVYRRFMNENGIEYSRLSKGQCRLPVLAFSIPFLPAGFRESNGLKQLDLPLDFVCHNRGKVIMRSDWSDSAMSFTFDARPDCFLIGHDTCSRGAFVISCNGHRWGFCPEWNIYNSCSDFSLPLIDNCGQEVKAPFAKMIDVIKGNQFTFASADLTYAYQWKWSNWAKKGADLTPQGFEREPNDPRDFGYNAWWAPHKIFGEDNVGFVGLNVWRKKISDVNLVTRSAIMIRAAKPFVIIADNVQKDDEEHEYSWAMTTSYNTEFEGFDGNEAILKESASGSSRFAIQYVGNMKLDLKCSFRTIIKENEKVTETERPRQIVFSCTSSQKVQFLFLMYSLNGNQAKNMESYWSNENVLSITNHETGEVRKISISCGVHGETKMSLVEKS